MIISSEAKRKGINNMPTEEHLANMKKLAMNIFQPLKEHFNSAIHISSGYRSAELNKAIGGASSSQHCLGEAMDIDMDGSTISNAQIFNWIKDNLIFDQMIWEGGTDANPDWVHVSYKSTGKQRKQLLKAIKRNGKMSYITF